MSTSSPTTDDWLIEYPDSDGEPMAENTLQFEWIVTIKEGLAALFADRPDVFVSGDLLWYPVEGDPKTRVAPDALVAFGRPQGYCGSYKQWEGGSSRGSRNDCARWGSTPTRPESRCRSRAGRVA